MNPSEIAQNVDSISLNPAVAGGQNELCKVWPDVKSGLQLLAQVINNPVVKVIIGTIIAAGDAITGKICK